MTTGDHRAPGHRPTRSALLGGLRAAAGVAAILLLLYGWIGPVPGFLDARASGHPVLLAVAGWVPVGGLLVAGGLVLRRGEPGRGERIARDVVGSVWIGFALVVYGYRGRYLRSDPDLATERVRAISGPIADGMDAGAFAVLAALVLVLAHLALRRRWPARRTLGVLLVAAGLTGLVAAVLVSWAPQ